MCVYTQFFASHCSLNAYCRGMSLRGGWYMGVNCRLGLGCLTGLGAGLWLLLGHGVWDGAWDMYERRVRRGMEVWVCN